MGIIHFWNQLVKTLQMTPILQKKTSENFFHHRGDPYCPKNLKRPCGGIKNNFFLIFFADIIFLNQKNNPFSPRRVSFQKNHFFWDTLVLEGLSYGIEWENTPTYLYFFKSGILRHPKN